VVVVVVALRGLGGHMQIVACRHDVVKVFNAICMYIMMMNGDGRKAKVNKQHK
jgi:hypothetical protein